MDFEPEARGACRVAFASAAGGGYSEQKAGAAVEKIEDQRQPDDFFGHRKRAISSPSAPAKKKAKSQDLAFFNEIHPGGWVKSPAAVKLPCGQ